MNTLDLQLAKWLEQREKLLEIENRGKKNGEVDSADSARPRPDDGLTVPVGRPENIRSMLPVPNQDRGMVHQEQRSHS